MAPHGLIEYSSDRIWNFNMYVYNMYIMYRYTIFPIAVSLIWKVEHKKIIQYVFALNLV